MDVFKYIVYEQVEEVGMDKWVAAKEPGSFLDECVIAVYKEGHCPKDVLEDINKVRVVTCRIDFIDILLNSFSCSNP